MPPCLDVFLSLDTAGPTYTGQSNNYCSMYTGPLNARGIASTHLR